MILLKPICTGIICFVFMILTGQFSFAQENKNGKFILPDNFYPILPWDFIDTKYSLNDIAGCNFTIAGFIKPYDIQEVEKFELKAIIDIELDIQGANKHRRVWRNLSDEEIDSKVKIMVANSGNSDAILGYFLMDEPSALDFSALGKAVSAVKKYAPGKLAYINLFPNYATLWSIDRLDSQLGTKSYAEYLERYVNEVNPQFISYDNYMVQYSLDLKKEESARSYFTNLLEVRRVALKYNLPYWNIVSSNQIRKHTTIPSMANMFLQAYTSLAAGFKGISWYQFNSNGYGYSPIDPGQNKTSTWYYLREVNRRILTIGPIINELASEGVYFTSPAPDSTFSELPGQIIESVKCERPMMIGEFTDQQGNWYAMIVNLSLDQSVSFTLSTKKAQENIILVIPSEDVASLPVFKKSDMNNHKSDFWLTAGEGILIKIVD